MIAAVTDAEASIWWVMKDAVCNSPLLVITDLPTMLQQDPADLTFANCHSYTILGPPHPAQYNIKVDRRMGMSYMS